MTTFQDSNKQIIALATAALGPEWITFGEMVSTLERILAIAQDAEAADRLTLAEKAKPSERHILDVLADERRNYHTTRP